MKGIRAYAFLYLLLAFIVTLPSCNTTGSDTYKAGYASGYDDGYKAGKESVLAQAPRKDPGSAITEARTDKEQDAIPAKAYQVLDHVLKENKAPDGYVGGRHFGNYERHLPERDAAGNKIEYREWDVNKKVQGKNRGAERLVTGSDGRAWFTNDHYNSFIEVK